LIYTQREEHDLCLFVRGSELFNQREFYAAHEFWEDLWLRNRSPARPLLQGLIQLAAAYHHVERANYVGLMALLGASKMRLQHFAPAMLGLDIEALLVDIAFSEAHSRELGPMLISTFEQPKMAWLRFTPPSLEAFLPHAGSVAGPASKHDWFWGRQQMSHFVELP
jgi:hypothetical protein